MREITDALDLTSQFPDALRPIAATDFEAAYSRLAGSEPEAMKAIESRIADYFAELELPEEPNLYDVLTLSLRDKDAIFTFNWDPFLLQSRIRLAKLGLTRRFPHLFFLHGNVMAGYCARDQSSGLIGRRCKLCDGPFEPSPLLFPVEEKDYEDGGMIEREWVAVREYLGHCFMLTIFGYSAPTTDVEARALLREGWGEASDRSMEQTEIVAPPGADHDALRETWVPFIHSHHYDIHESFYDSWLAKHPRRSGEAYWNQYWEAKFVSENAVPREPEDLAALAEWFKPLFAAEEGEPTDHQTPR